MSVYLGYFGNIISILLLSIFKNCMAFCLNRILFISKGYITGNEKNCFVFLSSFVHFFIDF